MTITEIQTPIPLFPLLPSVQILFTASVEHCSKRFGRRGNLELSLLIPRDRQLAAILSIA
jgi:hypothetical protein